jgi:hypothetical protein
MPTEHCEYMLDGVMHYFELPEGAILQNPHGWEWEHRHSIGINVFGCGLVLDPEDKLAIFFTMNGMLMGELLRLEDLQA